MSGPSPASSSHGVSCRTPMAVGAHGEDRPECLRATSRRTNTIRLPSGVHCGSPSSILTRAGGCVTARGAVPLRPMTQMPTWSICPVSSSSRPNAREGDAAAVRREGGVEVVGAIRWDLTRRAHRRERPQVCAIGPDRHHLAEVGAALKGDLLAMRAEVREPVGHAGRRGRDLPLTGAVGADGVRLPGCRRGRGSAGTRCRREPPCCCRAALARTPKTATTAAATAARRTIVCTLGRWRGAA